ncbi:unnamed protein product [Eretmochelys imbricata]
MINTECINTLVFIIFIVLTWLTRQACEFDVEFLSTDSKCYHSRVVHRAFLLNFISFWQWRRFKAAVTKFEQLDMKRPATGQSGFCKPHHTGPVWAELQNILVTLLLVS